MANWMIVTIKCIGVAWIVFAFFVVLTCYIRSVNNGKDPFALLFGAAIVWGIIGIGPIAVAKLAWRFVN